MRFPVDQPYAITTHFNSVTHPGIDIAPPAGKQGVACYAPEAGTVVQAASGVVEGNYVILKGVSGMFYYFGHFASQMMAYGRVVSEGQQIGVIGMTGDATGIHTHHEVRRIQGPGQSIDPEQYYSNIGDDMGLQQQNADLQAQIDIMRPDLVGSHLQIEGLMKELDAERASYEAQIAALQAQTGTITKAAVIAYINKNLS